MTDRKPVVVGVDGSPAAVNAVKWAVPEAVNRDVPLRLVHVCAPGSVLDDQDDVLCQASGIAEWLHPRTEIHRHARIGDPGSVLVAESRDAALVCIGSKDRQPPDPRLYGATAAALAGAAHCPVAIIRTGFYGVSDGVIATVVNDEPDNDEVLRMAMSEGRLRRATVRMIDRRLASWVRRYPDVHVETVAAGAGTCCGDTGPGPLQLAVVGRADADRLTSLTSLNCHPIVGYPDCSVLLVRA